MNSASDYVVNCIIQLHCQRGGTERERKCGGNSQQSNASCADLTAVPLSALAVYLSVLPPLSDSSISICLAAFLSLV